MPIYRKKPVDVEMIQWHAGVNDLDVVAFTDPVTVAFGSSFSGGPRCSFYVEKGASQCDISDGDWIARERDGSGYYPVTAAAFDDGYEPEPLD